MQNTAIGKALSRSRNALTTKMLLVMRMTAFLLILFFQASAFTESAAQVTLKESSATLEKVLKTIQQQSAYDLVFDKALLQAKAKPVTVNVTNVPVKEALDKVFAQQELLTYSLSGKIISVMERKGNPAMMLAKTEIPVIDVRGKVTDENGKPVVGASVQVKGSNKGTTTDENGFYVLSGVDEKATLVISAVNIETREVGVNGRNEINLVAKVKVSQLDDVAVTVNTGYQTIPKERATGSFAQPDKKMFDARVSADVLSRLEGITSSVTFNRDRSGNSSISIRGRSTILANTQPLIVVDNFPYDGELSNLNPNDVESIVILKDAAAASIYGVRAGNGVIVITTKKGKVNQPTRIEFNSNFTIGFKPDLKYDPQFLNSSDFIDAEAFLFNKGFYTADFASSNRVPISPAVEIFNRRKLGLITSSDSSNMINQLKAFDVRDDFSKYFFQTSLNQQYALNISGGSNTVAYYFSTGFDKGRSNRIGNESERLTVNSVLNFSPVKSLEISAGINLIQNVSKVNNTLNEVRTGGLGSSKNLYPYASFVDAQGSSLPIVKDYRSGYVDTIGGGQFLNWRYYPLDELNLADAGSKLLDARITTALRYQFFKGLSAEVRYQYEKGITKFSDYQSVERYYTRNIINRFTSFPRGVLKNNVPIGGIMDINNTDLVSNSFRAQLNFNRKWSKHVLVAIGGVEVREVTVSNQASRLYGFDPLNATSIPVNLDSLYTNLIPDGSSSRIPSNNDMNSSVDRFRSYFANASYTYNELYTLSLSGRIDQSNLFGVKSNQRSVPLWSIGGKWTISNESFYKLVWLPNLQVRASYGFNGNVNKSLSAYLIASYISSDAINRGPYAQVQSPGNPQLRWEKIGIINVGLDFSLKNNRLTGSLDFFYKRGEGMIGESPVPSSSGMTSLLGNFSNMIGKGFEIVLAAPVITRQFMWDTRVLFNYATDKVTLYNGGANTAYIVGRPVSYISSVPWAGLDPTTGEPRGYLEGVISKNYGALNNLTYAQRLYNGPANPSISGGLRNTFSWKGISLSANLSFKAGYYFTKSSISYSSFFSTWNGHADYSNRWQKSGDENFTQVPALIYPNNSSADIFYSNSSVLVEKGDHLRLQDISLSYDLNRAILKSIPFKSIQLYMYMNNIGILWRANRHGIDPDFQSGYPLPKSISFGFKARF